MFAFAIGLLKLIRCRLSTVVELGVEKAVLRVVGRVALPPYVILGKTAGTSIARPMGHTGVCRTDIPSVRNTFAYEIHILRPPSVPKRLTIAGPVRPTVRTSLSTI